MSNVVQKAHDHIPNHGSSKLIDLITYNHAIWKRENFALAEAAEDGMPVRFYKDLANWTMKTEPRRIARNHAPMLASFTIMLIRLRKHRVLRHPRSVTMK